MNATTWTTEQERALKAVRDWLPTARGSEEPIFRLFGYAGTGKTTLAKHFAESAGNVLFAAFTGKAASVMRSKGCWGAKTIHQLIYKPAPKSMQRLAELRNKLAELKKEEPTVACLEAQALILSEMDDLIKDLKKPSFVLNFDSEVKLADLLIIDECSMVGTQMAKDLLSFGTPILVLGDPAQLPPVASEEGGGYFTSAVPDVLLTEIHRQEKESPIIQLATEVRLGNCWPKFGTYGSSRVIKRSQLNPEEVVAADQILVGKNDTRRACNARYRELTGRPGVLPVPTDKLVCLRNNHKLGLLNGTLWMTDSVVVEDEDTLVLEIHPEEEDGGGSVVVAHRALFEGREMDFWGPKAESFDYGYALTTHKSQGSQWENVVVFDESYCFRRDRTKWLYTAITRASESITIVRD